MATYTTDTYTPNIGFTIQAYGSNINTWGTPANLNETTADSQLGGKFSVDVTGNSDYTLSAANSLFFYQVITGTLTGNIQYIVPNKGRRYLVNNQTSGATITIIPFQGATGVLLPQGISYIWIDPTAGLGAAYDITSGGGGPQSLNIRTVTTSQTVLQTDRTILVDATSGPITITLLSPASVPNQIFSVKKIDSSPNQVTVSGLIDGQATFVLQAQYWATTVQSNGSAYWAGV